MDVKDPEAVASSRNGALWASEGAGRRLPKLGLLAALSTGAIMTQPHLALGLPGHRALTWLALLFIMRLAGGPGWATAVGLAAAVGTMAIGRSPDGSLWGVLPYAVAGFGIDAVLWAKPAVAAGAVRMAALGAATLLSVGWIAPLGKGFLGSGFSGSGAQAGPVWRSITDVQPAAWVRLVAFDTAFGAGAALIAYGLLHGVATVADHRRGRRGEALAPTVSRL
jgi:hypothetical protein